MHDWIKINPGWASVIVILLLFFITGFSNLRSNVVDNTKTMARYEEKINNNYEDLISIKEDLKTINESLFYLATRMAVLETNSNHIVDKIAEIESLLKEIHSID